MPRRLPRVGPGPPACLVLLAATCLFSPPSQACGVSRYGPHDPLVELQPDTLQSLFFSRSAWVVQFYARWSAASAAFAPTWRALAQDIKDWRPTLKLGVIDCGKMCNEKMCSDFEVTAYPTVKFLKPFSTYAGDGIKLEEIKDDPQSLREAIITFAESHLTSWWSPDAPLLAPLSTTEFVDSIQGRNVALIFEGEDSFLGREVILDMAQYKNIVVRRVLKSNAELVTRCKVTTFPSGFLYSSKGSCTPIPLANNSRSFYTDFLRTLPGVQREIIYTSKPPIAETKATPDSWEVADRTQLCMADLEYAVLCSLHRIEVSLANFTEERLSALKHYVHILAKYFPERSAVHNYLHKLEVWQESNLSINISRNEWIEDLKAAKEGLNASFPETPDCVGCQGNIPGFESYLCSLQIIFHLLAVQEALKSDGANSSSEVFPAAREFMTNFYFYSPAAKRFASLPAEFITEVKDQEEAIFQLWSTFTGAESKDGEIPRTLWPPQDLCPSCSEIVNEKIMWKKAAVLNFLKKHFSMDNIS
ncbi:sulfhydryl oxidase 1 [Podarcis lilfordi]|uniref:Sulfhydryl oxidase 1 n=1 Tax=Podarcis lilfordi TaxID=74358 RepID=A0AA35NVW2_9SAUR|nr:sulfhydryl oxidase 1 [Podarcis lilfordi]